MEKIDKTSFLAKYKLTTEIFEATTIKWEELEQIYYSHIKEIPQLESSAIFIFNRLMKIANIHSVRYRIKDPEHLLEKIIRRRIEEPEITISFDNYKEIITDLVGLRALHLFKENWIDIHKSIIDTWTLKQQPVANYRKGDPENYIEIFKENGCEIKEHKYGYRSIHYIVETQPTKLRYYAEIQVRTIFEEAWSEIDHTIRYPYDQENIMFLRFLMILNRLAGSADEMGSFIIFLKKELEIKDALYNDALNNKEAAIKSLNSQIKKLKIDQSQKDLLKISLDKLTFPKIDPTSILNFSLPIIDYAQSFDSRLLDNMLNDRKSEWPPIEPKIFPKLEDKPKPDITLKPDDKLNPTDKAKLDDISKSDDTHNDNNDKEENPDKDKTKD